MKRNEQGAIILDDNETIALGMLIAVRKLEDVEDWLYWEDQPGLDADGFNRAVDVVRERAAKLSITLGAFERTHGIDARHLWGEVA